ncbi:MAG: NACHT domain-containing protein, partial [Anaerolineales bacterium]|nr:NACHT domain-containing protein [Anaerolineales bacterium]
IQQTINNFTQYDKNSDPKILEDQLVNYLKWVKDYFEYIELRGIEQGESPVIRLKLDEVYIPLQAETLREAEEFIEDQFRIKEKGTRIKPTDRAENRRIQLDELLVDDKTRIIITGGPGCGKTTVLQHIAWSLAQGWLENSNFAEKKTGIKPPYPLPIYVPLNLYARHLRDFANAPAKKRTLAGFISEYLVLNMVGPEISSDFFAFLLQEKDSVLLLLDGLDEVPTEDERIQVRNDIEKLISGKDNLRMVVTSRTAAYIGPARLGHDFRHIRVLPLQMEQIESMVRKAYNYRFVNSPTRAKKSANDLIEGIQRLEQERRKRLGENAEPLVDSPLMVRMMLVVAANNRVLPNQRADLYDKTVNAMLRPENILDEKVAEDISKRVGGGVSIHREMLQTLAFHLHQRGEKQGKEVDEQILREILEPAYAIHIDDLLKLARARGGVLDFRGGAFRFLHLSFQEFLVGRYLAEQMREIDGISRFIEDDKVLDSWWREPILLLCGYLDINAPKPAKELLSRLGGLDENANERNRSMAQNIQIASAELASSALLEFQQAIPDLAEQLAERLVKLIEDEKPSDLKLRASAGDTLARLGDPRFDENNWQLPKEPLLGFVHIPAGEC